MSHPGLHCVPCAAGKFVNTSTAESRLCESCPLGTYQPFEGSGYCKTCPGGLISVENRQTCSFCNPGRFVQHLRNCVQCPVATYAPAALMDACMECAAGYYTGVPLGATSCTACDPGFANGGVTKFVCSECKVTPSPKPLNEIYPS